MLNLSTDTDENLTSLSTERLEHVGAFLHKDSKMNTIFTCLPAPWSYKKVP